MALKRRAGIYYVKFKGPDGRPVVRSSGTRDKAQAQEYHDQLKADLWKAKRLKQKPRRTFDEAALRYLQEKSSLSSYSELCRNIKWFRVDLRDCYLDEITRDRIDDMITKRCKHVGNRTKDLKVAVIRNMLNVARGDWEWIDTVPTFRKYVKGKVKRRMKFLKEAEVEALIKLLPRHTRLAMLFSLATGLRKANVCGLMWHWIDLDNKVLNVPDTKNGEALTIPLNEMVIDVLNSVRGDHPDYVFTYRGKPVRNTNTKAWRKALKEAGIKNFRWHDLRHTWASWLRQRGVPTWALTELAGWKTEAMAKHYAHINVEHLTPYADRIGVQNWVQ